MAGVPGAVLVTGATGLIGQATSRFLAAQGARVRGSDRVPAEGGASDWTQCDLSDGAALRDACRGVDAVVHLGGISGPGAVFDPPIPPGTVASTNILGTLNVLEAARENGVRRVVFASSVCVYWPVGGAKLQATPLTEGSSPVDSPEAYAASKVAGEQLCRAYAAQGLVDTVSLRLGWVYGPGRTTGCEIRDMLQGGPSTLPPGHARDYIYVDDAAEAVAAAVARPAPFGGGAVNVSGAHVAQAEVERAAEAVLGRPVERRPPTPDCPPPDQGVPPLDLAKAARELGWRPRVPLAEGVRLYAEHLGVLR